jgi:hypothetical protein
MRSPDSLLETLYRPLRCPDLAPSAFGILVLHLMYHSSILITIRAGEYEVLLAIHLLIPSQRNLACILVRPFRVFALADAAGVEPALAVVALNEVGVFWLFADAMALDRAV